MRLIGIVGAVWGVVGVMALLLGAVYRLTPIALEAFRQGLAPWQWLLTGVLCAFMAYSEAYRGFHLRFSPRTAQRIRSLRESPDVVNTLLAPLYAMGYFRADRRTMISAYALTTMIVGLVMVVQRLGQPWRGIVDSGVVVGLALGVLSLAWCIIRALRR